MPLPDDFLERWEHLIEEVAKTEVPLECIKKVVIILQDRRQRTINLALLRKQGLDMEEIEVLLSRKLAEFSDQIKDIDFVIDAGLVAELVQPETDKLLSKLK